MGTASRPQPRGICPVYEDATAATDPSMLESEAADLGYSPELDCDDDAVKELETMVARRWIRNSRNKLLTKRLGTLLAGFSRIP